MRIIDGPKPKLGARVRLRWDGQYGLPHWLNGDLATIVGYGGGGPRREPYLVVQPDHDTKLRRVRIEQTIEVFNAAAPGANRVEGGEEMKNAKEKIREALKQIMSEGEANACRIYKNWEGWHYQRFGQAPIRLENNLKDSLAAIQGIFESREIV